MAHTIVTDICEGVAIALMHVLSHASNQAKARIRKGLISIGLTLKLVSTVESAFKFAPLMEQFWRKRDKNFKNQIVHVFGVATNQYVSYGKPNRKVLGQLFTNG